MNRAQLFADALLRGFKILVRDVACPILGLYLLLRIGQGTYDTAAIPFVGGLASALVGVTYWWRVDERRRDENGESRRSRRRITIDDQGIRWGERDDGSGS